MKEAYFHEDDYCQIELTPIENEDFIKNELAAIHNFANEHKVKDGVGWSEMYMRVEPKSKLVEKQITIQDFENTILVVTSKFDKVFTGYSSYKEECKFTNCYGDDRIKIFVEYNENIITSVWFDYFLESKEKAILLNKILLQITSKFDLIFVNWPGEFYSRPQSDQSLLNRFIEESNECQNLKINMKTTNLKKSGGNFGNSI